MVIKNRKHYHSLAAQCTRFQLKLQHAWASSACPSHELRPLRPHRQIDSLVYESIPPRSRERKLLAEFYSFSNLTLFKTVESSKPWMSASVLWKILHRRKKNSERFAHTVAAFLLLVSKIRHADESRGLRQQQQPAAFLLYTRDGVSWGWSTVDDTKIKKPQSS